MKILVTGGTGMTGKAMQTILGTSPPTDKVYIFVGSKQADLTDYEQTRKLFMSIQPDIVIHLAAIVGGLFFNINNNANLLDANTRINLNVIKSCIEAKVKKVITVLSTCAFPQYIDTYPITEDDVHKGPVHHSNEGYGESKRIAEILSRLYSHTTDTKFLCVFPCNLYGKHDNFSEKGHVLSGLISKCHEAKLYPGSDFVVYGSGNPLRQFLYVDDFARILISIIDKFDHIKDERLILCNDDDELSINSLAQIVANTVGYMGSIVNDVSKSDGLFRKTVTNKLFRQYFPEFKFTSLSDGIKDCYSWFLENCSPKHKITCNIWDGLAGGIGNQLFAIATTLAVAWDHNLEPFFRFLGNHKYSYQNNYTQNILKRLPFSHHENLYGYHTIQENNACDPVDLTHIPTGVNIQLSGYFQSPHYFEKYKDKIVKLLYLSDEDNKIVNDIVASFKTEKRLIGVHCRRADYTGLGWTLPIEYYQRAMSMAEFAGCDFVLFSDDIDWCKDTFPGNKYCSTGNDITDFFIMSKMDGIIMANSTFSWWAVYIGNIKDVVCPSPWFKNYSFNKGLYSNSSWKILEY